jgi:hypothetical protein
MNMEQAAIAADVALVDYEANYANLLEVIRLHFAAHSRPGAPNVFATDVENLFGIYLDALPSDRQYHTCHTCRQFIERFGGLVTIEHDGTQQSAIWPEDLYSSTYGFYAPAVAAMRAAVEKAKVTGVFYSSEKVWGQPITGNWTHFAVVPPAHLVHIDRTKTAFQASAEKREDYRTMITALQEFTLPMVETAVTLLKTDSLYRSEKCLGAAEWLRNLIVARNATKNSHTRTNLLWRAVATAPAGFAHPRSSMIGTLLEDIHAGLPFEDVKAKFAAKMHPLQYQRPQAAPTAGAIAQAEKLVEQLGIARSLERRFARVEELHTLWRPIWSTQPTVAPAAGVFGHLQPKGDAPIPSIKVPTQVMTWDKFSRTVLPTAERIEILIPTRSSFSAFLTALHADAPPIIQWDREEQRNPVTTYIYTAGSLASTWGLSAGAWGRVTAVSLRPSQWFEQMAHHGEGVMFVIEGARDSNYERSGNALFPETLKSELHAVRSVVEAYSKRAVIHGYEEASACGLLFGKRNGEPFESNRIRVTSKGATLEYSLDRWD